MSGKLRSLYRVMLASLLGSTAASAYGAVSHEDPASQAGAETSKGSKAKGIELAQGTVEDLEQFLQMYSTGASRPTAPTRRQVRPQRTRPRATPTRPRPAPGPY